MKTMGRCLTVWIKDLVKLLPTLEMLNMTQIKEWLVQQAHLIKVFQEQHELPFKGRLVEIDVKEMFPSIPMNRLLQALKWLFKRWKDAKRRSSRAHWYFSIHKLFKTMDCIGKHNEENFFVITWYQIITYIKWDLYHNVYFHHSSTLYKQKNGVPIGGAMSAQSASLYFMACESFHLTNNVYQSAWFGSATRFRDNILLIILQDISVTEILLLFKLNYKLEFTKEQASHTIESLESILILNTHHTDNFFDRITIQWKNCKLPTTKFPFQKLHKLVDKSSLNAKSVLKSYLPSAIQKCYYYSINNDQIDNNLKHRSQYLQSFQFPRHWLKPILREVWKRGIG